MAVIIRLLLFLWDCLIIRRRPYKETDNIRPARLTENP